MLSFSLSCLLIQSINQLSIKYILSGMSYHWGNSAVGFSASIFGCKLQKTTTMAIQTHIYKLLNPKLLSSSN